MEVFHAQRVVAALSVAALGAGGAQVASATGQPNPDCATVPVADQPPGFQAQRGQRRHTVRAHAQSSAAVSQYDVACVQKAAH